MFKCFLGKWRLEVCLADGKKKKMKERKQKKISITSAVIPDILLLLDFLDYIPSLKYNRKKGGGTKKSSHCSSCVHPFIYNFETNTWQGQHNTQSRN